MSENKKKHNWLKSLLKINTDGAKPNRKSQYILLILGLGIAMMLVQNLIETPDSTAVMNNEEKKSKAAFSFKKSDDLSSIQDMSDHYENQLKELLDEMAGVKDATVVITLESTPEKIVHTDVNQNNTTTDETDQRGGTRKSTTSKSDEKVIILQNEGGEQPIVVRTEMPEVKGVGIIANGAENLQVKLWIIEVVSRVLDVPSHRVSVQAKKQKGE